MRTTDNGIVASFSYAHSPGEMGKEFVALAPAELRTTVA